MNQPVRIFAIWMLCKKIYKGEKSNLVEVPQVSEYKYINYNGIYNSKEYYLPNEYLTSVDNHEPRNVSTS